MASSWTGGLRASALLFFGVGGFGEAFDRAEALVPAGGEIGHGLGGLVETAGLHLVEDLAAVLAPADQAGLFENGQVLGHRLAGEGHLAGQPAGADVTVADEEVEDPAAGRVRERRPQLVIGLRAHADQRFATTTVRRSRKSPQPARCSPA